MRHGCFISRSFLGLATFAALAAGCAATRSYEIVSPGTSRGPVPPNAGQIVARDKIEYEVFSLEGSVVLRFVNRTGAPIRLSEQSVLFDAAGRSFKVDPQDVGPDESGRLVLPPSTPAEKAPQAAMATEVHVGGIDEGGLIGSRRDVEENTSNLSPGAAAAPPPGFRWRPGQTVRARLIYRIGDADSLTHEWAIRRAK